MMTDEEAVKAGVEFQEGLIATMRAAAGLGKPKAENTLQGS
jgi:hypothetical protein